MEFQDPPKNVQVYDANGKALLTQIVEQKGNRVRFLFLARVPLVGLAVFDVRETTSVNSNGMVLTATDKTIENNYLQSDLCVQRRHEQCFRQKTKP